MSIGGDVVTYACFQSLWYSKPRYLLSVVCIYHTGSTVVYFPKYRTIPLKTKSKHRKQCKTSTFATAKDNCVSSWANNFILQTICFNSPILTILIKYYKFACSTVVKAFTLHLVEDVEQLLRAAEILSRRAGWCLYKIGAEWSLLFNFSVHLFTADEYAKYKI